MQQNTRIKTEKKSLKKKHICSTLSVLRSTNQPVFAWPSSLEVILIQLYMIILM